MSDQGRLVAGRYRLLDRTGRGGMGTVWRAEDELLGRQVAVKKLHVPAHLHDDERATLYERTRREARSAARITHPNVVVVHDVVEDEGLPCIVMEYVRSRTLGEVIKEDGPLTPREAARIGRGMIAALRAAHRAGVLHRDVKPANVLLGGADDTDGADGAGGRAGDRPGSCPARRAAPGGGDGGWSGGRVVLTDFGIAAASGTSTLTRTGELVGSYDYMSPERLRGVVAGPAADLWALGATLYQALEGAPPFRRGTPVETAYAIAADPFEVPGRAGRLAPLIVGLLEKDPERRFTAEQAERLLIGSAGTVRAGGPVTAGRVPVGPVPGDPAAADVPPSGPAAAAGAGTGTGGGSASRREDTPVTAVRTPPATGPGPGALTRWKGGRGGRTARWAAVAAVALLVPGALLAAMNGPGPAGPAGPGVAGAPSPEAPDGGAEPGARGEPGGDAGSAPALPPAPPAPAGYRTAHDPLGFTVTVPGGWTRQEKAHGQEVNYIDATGRAGLKFTVLDFAGASPLQHWKDIEPEVRSKLAGYQRLRMNATTYQGRPAAYWEFSWQGSVRPYRAVDLGISAEGQREYAIYLSAPADEWRDSLPHFKVAADSFRADP